MDKMTEMIQFITEFKMQNRGVMPLTTEIARALGVPRTRVNYYFNKAVEMGLLTVLRLEDGSIRQGAIFLPNEQWSLSE
jgi:hypothetical protein